MRSMTGFGRSEGTIGNNQYTFEVKSVNHRFLDVRFRLPQTLTALEFLLAEKLKSHFDRGSFEVSCKQKLVAQGGHATIGTRFVVDDSAVKSLLEGVEWIKKQYGISCELKAESLLATNRVFLPIEDGKDAEVLQEPLKALFEVALVDLKKMRLREGDALKAVLLDGVGEIEKLVKKLQGFADLQTTKIREKLELRIQNWKLTAPVDASRLEFEVALMAEKADIREELDRLLTHVKEYRMHIESGKNIGRKLDFLTQELNREANTVASKANLIDITQTTVELKTVIERLREQVQNVE